jgi:UDP-glucose 4-epimerase
MVNKMKIVVTGGAGFIGSHLVDELLSRDYAVTVLDNLSNGSLNNLNKAQAKTGFTFIKGDILNPYDCIKATRDCAVVFHLACLGVRHSLHSPVENHEVNARGTLNVLEASMLNNIQRFYYISTSEVYGKTTDFPISEKSLAIPTTVYGASKLAGENYSRAYNEKGSFKSYIFRIFNNYGPRAHHEGDAGEIIPRTIVNLIYEKQPILFGDGSITRDFLFVKDTACILSDMIDHSMTPGDCINIGTGKEISMKDLIERIMKLMEKKFIGIKFLNDRPADVPRLWVDNRKFLEIYGIKLIRDMDESLIETIKYYQDLSKCKNLIQDIEDVNWIK